MKYIDKNTHIQRGHDITDHYLQNACRVDDGNGNYHYQNVDYDGSFRESGSKADMQQLALDNQENYCCYCMRDLNMQNQQVTLEHIIPQSCSAVKFNEYTALNISYLTSGDVVRTSDFTGMPNVKVPPRPHAVTFENLVVSCDGTFPDKEGSSQCCNHKRGEKDIYPLFYIDSVGDEIAFTEDGTIQPNARCAHPTEYRNTINRTRLNCLNLLDIRRLWHLFENISHADLVACLNDKDHRDRILKQVLFHNVGMVEQDVRIQNKFMRDAYWKTFLLYHWFHHRI